ncbi:glutathione S-transferase 1-like [Drosophila busckii]|uniref:glutathione S-transferase 1-like n=1 Tax=Drosophila busckii TaxID=30019 RepID=UPI00083EF53F|nr:glutathione S-transferase 1-like [Drosophila busckii]XP_017852845.1 glutathione S-transferase 1-like [Drosophila busckii]
MSKIIVYGIDLSPPVRAVLLTLKALELPYEYKEVDLASGGHKRPEFLQKNPQGTVPTIDDNGSIIWDSHAICSYLVDKYGKTDALYPKDLLKRAGVNQRMYFDASSIYMALWNCSRPFWVEGCTVVSKEKTGNILEALRLTDVFLGENLYITGDTLTIADFCCAATVSSLPAVLDIDPVKYSKVTAWLERLSKLPYYAEANAVGATKYIQYMRSQWTNVEL